MKQIISIIIAFLAFSNGLIASPYHGQIEHFKQPDGTLVDVKLYGTEFYMRAEGLDGYTLIRDSKTNWICYASLSKDKSTLISTGIVYRGIENNNSSLKNDLSIEKHLDISDVSRNEAIKKNTEILGYKKNKTSSSNALLQKTATTPSGLVAGNIKGLCIVVDFSDEVGTLPMSEFNNFCNNLNYSNFGNNGSLRKFYKDISGGIVDYENVVYGYYRAPNTFAYYDAMPYAEGAQEILGLALNWIDSQGFDFSTLSINPDGSIQAINLMYTGVPPTWAQGMWHHRGWYTNFSADGVHSNDYNCSPAGSPLKLAVVAHENGHMIGKWPDTYKYGSTTGPDGIGSFDLMSYYGNFYNPVPPNPLFRSNVGWGKVIDVTNYNGLNTDTANSSICYKYRNINDTNEFFLLENRMKTGRSTFIPDQGLTIWHIDRKGDNQSIHHEVWLEHADNDYSNENHACFKNGFNNEYSYNTAPNSTFYNGDPSGLRVWDIGNINTNLNYKLGSWPTGPSLKLLYNNISGDNNANGFIEASESANINVSALNLGQLSSASATVSCVAIINAGYVTINTAPINVGVINVSQTIPTSFNISIAANTPIGTDIQLKFTLSDGTNSIYITRTITIGEIITIDNTPSTTCAAMFYDEGKELNYQDNSNYTKTFLPSTPGQPLTVNFLNFDVEDDVNCTYDYLSVYNGPNTSGTLLGTYCGSVNPGQLTSTDPSGALTFVFISDGGYTSAGWKATISCNNLSGIDDLSVLNSLNISPNPSTGVFKCNMNTNTDVELTVTDVLGKEILRSHVNNLNQFNIDLSNQTNGIYFLKATINNHTVNKKLILSN